MAFPYNDLELTCEAAFGADLTADPDTWNFTDLSARVIDNPITISRGVLVGTNTSKSAAASGLTLLNDDGQLTPYLPTSTYWPYVDVGTPLRLSIRDPAPWVSDTFTRTVASGWGVANTGQAWVNTTAMSVNGNAAQISIATTNTARTNRIVRPHTDAEVYFDASLAAVSTGAPNSVGVLLRSTTGNTDQIWAAYEFSQSGAINWTIFTYASSVSTLRQQALQPGLTYTGGTRIRGHVLLVGDRLRARAWLAAGTEPNTWAIDVTLPTIAGTSGYVGVQGWVQAGNTNTLPNPISVDNLTFQQPRNPRIEGYITDVQPSFRPLGDGTTHSVVQVSVGGVGTRLERLAAPAWSPLRRSLQLAAVPPVELWMLEDNSGASSAASAFDGHPPMTVTGPAVFAFDVGVPEDEFISRYGASSLCSLAAGAKLSGTVQATGAWTAWTASLLVDQFTSLVGGGVTEVRQLEWTTPGAALNRWALVRTMTGHTVRAYNDTAQTATDVCSFTHNFGSLYMVEVAATQSGGNISVALYINANSEATGSIAGTVAAVSRVQANPDQSNTTGSTSPVGIRFVVGAIMIHDQAGTWLPFYNDTTTGQNPRADRGWGYEAAHRRAMRQADEEHVPFRVVGDPYTTGVTMLNAQQPGAFTDLIKATVDAMSGALLWDDGFGYALRDRTDRYNAPVDLPVDLSAYRYRDGTDPQQVLVPKLDARGPNYWTVTRTGGSSATYAAPAAYRKRRGTVAAEAVLDVLYDTDCSPHASWRTHLSVDGQGATYPAFTIDLAANPGLVEAWLQCTIGSRAQWTNQPAVAGLGVIDQVIEGITETFAPRTADSGPTWTAVLDTSPAQVWQVGAYDSGFRYDSASTILVGSMTASSTSVKIGSLPADVWSTTGVPYDWPVAGEQMTVTAMGAPTIDATLSAGDFESNASGWDAVNVTLVQSSTVAHSGTFSGLMTVTGSPSVAYIRKSTALVPRVVPGMRYTASAWVQSMATLPDVRVTIDWSDANHSYLSTTDSGPASLTAGSWVQRVVTVTAPAGAAYAQYGTTIGSSPSVGTVLYTDDVILTSSTVLYQTATVIRAVNGIPKAHTGGEPVHIANPARYAL